MFLFFLWSNIFKKAKENEIQGHENHVNKLNSRKTFSRPEALHSECTKQTSPPYLVNTSSKLYLIFGFQNASARCGFLTILMQMEAKDLCQRWTLRNHQERCGRLLQKTHFAAPHQVLQVALSSPPSPWQMFRCAVCELLHILSPAVSVQPQLLTVPHSLRVVCRTKLTSAAEKESIAMFVRNLRQRLLVCPVRGCVIMGVDPGFKHGCKLAVLSPTSEWQHWALLNSKHLCTSLVMR